MCEEWDIKQPPVQLYLCSVKNHAIVFGAMACTVPCPPCETSQRCKMHNATFFVILRETALVSDIRPIAAVKDRATASNNANIRATVVTKLFTRGVQTASTLPDYWDFQSFCEMKTHLLSYPLCCTQIPLAAPSTELTDWFV